MQRLRHRALRVRYWAGRAAKGFRIQAAERLLIAPQELESGDPSLAVSFYSGHVLLAGRTVQTRGQSPFQIEAPHPDWARALHGFAWLRNFRDSENYIVRHHARALVGEWLKMRELRADPIAQAPAVVARRMLSWLNNAPLLLADADHGTYQRFMRALARDAQWLEACAAGGFAGFARLSAAIALSEYTLCALTPDADWQRASQFLAAALHDLVLVDGTPATRNPADALQTTIDLLQLRTAYGARSRTPPPELQATLNNLFAFLRMVRHPDGALALFNGMAATPLALLGSALAFGDAGASPPLSARFGGYQRVQAADTVLLVDAGTPPPPPLSERAHAGALSFEFSAGAERIIVNCGAGPEAMNDLREALRETAAHAALVIDGLSTARFQQRTGADGGTRRRLIRSGEGPRIDRTESSAETILSLRNDGYQPVFGVVHHRILRIARDGSALSGKDHLERTAQRGAPQSVVLRFHLHPRVAAALQGDDVVLSLPDGAVWRFAATGGSVSLDETIFMGGLSSQRRSQQIVVTCAAEADGAEWTLTRQ